MAIKVSQFIADFLVAHQIQTVFTLTGGGAMHLNDALGHHPKLKCVYAHHEQACAIGAEAYTRFSGRVAAVCVTSGPGGTNAITGVLGAWLDSIPMIVLSGQVKRETTTRATNIPLRQLGDQEFDIVSSVQNMTKYAVCVMDPQDIAYHLEKAYYLSKHGRGGPVWIDVPLDVQAAMIDPETLSHFDPKECEHDQVPVYDTLLTQQIIDQLSHARRPVIFVGSGVRLAGAQTQFIELAEMLQIPVVTAWNAHDLIWDHHPLYCGRPGTVGTRGGNFVVQNADCLLILGSRLNIRQISYNYKDFAPKAYKIMVDIDRNELIKPTIHIDMPIWADLNDVLKHLLSFKSSIIPNPDHQKWLTWARQVNQRFPIVLPEYSDETNGLNPYLFMQRFFQGLREDDCVVCGNGSACVIGFQAAVIQEQTRLFTNSGCAAMGYGFPAAIGAAFVNQKSRVICIDGDGSFQMNIQELQTVFYHQLNVKIIYINNNGYHSIRQTQSNLFDGKLVGVCEDSGVGFPDIERVAWAYQLPFIRITSAEHINELHEFIDQIGPVFCEICVDPTQNFVPKLSSKVLPDGRIVSPPIDDMFPFLDREEYEACVIKD